MLLWPSYGIVPVKMNLQDKYGQQIKVLSETTPFQFQIVSFEQWQRKLVENL